MPLPEPAFDTRTYRELLAESVARIPVHNPEWNNFNDSDPGITMLQLFAFMAESVIYRANRIPARNRQKFLQLLGVPMQPARSAEGLVTFSVSPGLGLSAVEVRDTDEVRAGNLPFRLERGLLVLPVEGRAYFKARVEEPRRSEIQAVYDRLFASIRQPSQALEFYETRPLPDPAPGLLPTVDLAQTADRSLWLALLARLPADVELARAALSGRVIMLGLVPALDADGKALYPAGPPAAVEQPQLVFEVPDARTRTPAYRPLEIASSEDVLNAPGLVELRLPAAAELGTWTDLGPLEAGVGGYPPALENSEDLARLVTWIRIRAPQLPAVTMGGQARLVVSWAGINAARVVQRTRVDGERLPDGTGEPDQKARLAHAPVIVERVTLTVNGESWLRVDDLSDAAPEVPPGAPRLGPPAPTRRAGESKAFTLDRESGQLQFGDGTRGMRPPRGAVILCSYDYGGGAAGLVGIGAISRAPDRLPGVTVLNPIPTWGGSDGETVERAEKRIPQWLRHRDVLGTREDYEQITWATPGVEMGRVNVLSLTHPDLPTQPAEGVVTLLVIPRTDPAHPETPSPDRLFLETVCAYLEPRRIVTTELHVEGPDYVPLVVGIGIQAVPGEPEGPLAERVRRAVLDFLSPLIGGFDGKGWPLQKTVEAAEVQAAATRVRGVAKVTGLVLATEEGTELPSGLPLTGLQLPRVTVRVGLGAAPTLAQMFAGPPPADEVPALPVPVAPEEC